MKVIIIGGGKIGSYLAKLLRTNGHKIQIIEHREKVVAELLQELPEEVVLLGNGTDPDVLQKAGISSVDVVAAVSGADEINLVVSTLAKMEFGVPRVVARVNNPKNTWLFNKGMGVDTFVNQADIITHLIAEEMHMKDMLTLLKFSNEDYSIVQMKVGERSTAVNKCIKEVAIPQETVLIGIIRNAKFRIPKADTQIRVEDHILALADEKSRRELNELFS